MMNITIQSSATGKVATLHLTGSVTGILEAVELREKISAAANEGASWVVLDCTELTFINSVGLGMIIAGLTSLRNRGGDLCLARVNDDIIESLTKTMLTSIIQLFDTTEEAVAAFSPRTP